jgi:hypothetical protein
MKTLSINQIQQALGQVVKSFQYVEGYKVEVSMWDHTQQPILQLYVACTVNNKHTSIHTRSQSLPEALEEVKQWYRKVTAPQFAMNY